MPIRSFSHRLLAACLTLGGLPLAGSAPAAAREAPPDRKPAFALSAEARFRPEWRDDADLDGHEDDDTRQGFMRLRLGLDLRFGEPIRLLVQAQDSRVAGEEVSTGSNERNLDLHQGYLELRPTATRRLRITMGRQELAYGDERLIGAFGWDNVGRSFDGAKARYERDRWWVDGFAARVASRRTASGAATTGSDLYGAYARWAPRAGVEREGYLLSFQESVQAAGETAARGGTAIQAAGARVKQRFRRFDFTAEAVIEKGRFHGDDLSAHAAAAEGGLTWGETCRLRLAAGYDHASGDEDPVDGKREEFFNFFPTNHPHYGYADYEGWRNLRSPWAGASLRTARHHLEASVHRFHLEEEAGPWKDAAGSVLGHDPSGSSGTRVGAEVDLLYRLTLPEAATLQAGLSRFAPSRFARRTRGDDPSWWGYLMLTWKFAS